MASVDGEAELANCLYRVSSITGNLVVEILLDWPCLSLETRVDVGLEFGGNTIVIGRLLLLLRISASIISAWNMNRVGNQRMPPVRDDVRPNVKVSGTLRQGTVRCTISNGAMRCLAATGPIRPTS